MMLSLSASVVSMPAKEETPSDTTDVDIATQADEVAAYVPKDLSVRAAAADEGTKEVEVRDNDDEEDPDLCCNGTEPTILTCVRSPGVSASSNLHGCVSSGGHCYHGVVVGGYHVYCVHCYCGYG